MLTRKQCAKCGGNIYLSSDYYGRYEQCLQCGMTYDLDKTVEEQPKLVTQRKETPVAA